MGWSLFGFVDSRCPRVSNRVRTILNNEQSSGRQVVADDLGFILAAVERAEAVVRSSRGVRPRVLCRPLWVGRHQLGTGELCEPLIEGVQGEVSGAAAGEHHAVGLDYRRYEHLLGPTCQPTGRLDLGGLARIVRQDADQHIGVDRDHAPARPRMTCSMSSTLSEVAGLQMPKAASMRLSRRTKRTSFPSTMKGDRVPRVQAEALAYVGWNGDLAFAGQSGSVHGTFSVRYYIANSVMPSRNCQHQWLKRHLLMPGRLTRLHAPEVQREPLTPECCAGPTSQ